MKHTIQRLVDVALTVFILVGITAAVLNRREPSVEMLTATQAMTLTAPIETTSIGVVAPVFRCAVPPPRRVRRTDSLGAAAFPPDRFEWVRIIPTKRNECSVRVQITDLVTDQRAQCFAWDEWNDPDFGAGWMVIPVEIDPERSIEYAPGQWIRMAHVRGGKRRAVRH